MSNCNCEPKTYNIGMGCCVPVLAPIENYYTKWQIDRMIESATTSGCCITPEEVDDKISSAKTEIENEIPTSNTAFTNDAGYLTEHQSLEDYATTAYVNTQISSQTGNFVSGEELSSYTYDKSTIDLKIAQGGTFDPSLYYDKTATDALLADKLDASAYTPTDLSNYYNKTEVDNKVSQSTSGLQETLSAGTNVSISNNVISATDTKYTAGDGIQISGNTISTTTKFQCLTEQEWASVSGNPDTNTVYFIR